MKSKNTKFLFATSVIYYIIATVLMIVGTNNDLQITSNLFNPSSKLAIIFECFGQFVYWGMWGPIGAVLFLTRHDLNNSLTIINRLLPFIKPFSNVDTKLYKALNTLLKIITAVGFFVLAVVGYKKLVENVCKKFVDLSQPIYFVICAIIAVISILLMSKINKNALKKLELLALMGVLFGIGLKVVENCKDITQRVRFREMLAFDNGVLDEDGLSHGSLDGLKPRVNSNMQSDFSDYTPWYKMGIGSNEMYNHADSFPSGHTSYSNAIFMLYPLSTAFEKLKKLAPFALIISLIYVALMGYTRLVAGAHYLTDVAGGAIIGYTLFLITYYIYTQFDKKSIIA